MKKIDVENNPYHSFLDVLLKKSSYTYTFEKSIAKKQKKQKLILIKVYKCFAILLQKYNE